MRIKKIEVLGFKSFAEREVVALDDRVTAVLGPNGCGKSNIVDAIRWCLGEQRAKHLRGQGMSDVIFAGCASRGPAGMAEVTITFENEGDLPPVYASYAEIGVTRRLFSDGTSEYLINKVPCRLRDINDMLSGTGVGNKGYSIIEQGAIGQIVTSKPETRRQVIDEAAGIMKFKSQRQTAERRIAQTRQNLLRVHDVLGELGGRLGTLRRQAQKAERYRRYRDELRDLELWRASHRFLEMRSTGAVLDKRREDVSEQVEALRNETAVREAKLEHERLELRRLGDDLQGAQQSVYDLENRISLIEQDRRFKQKERESLIRAAEQSRNEAAMVAAVLDGHRQELTDVEARRNELGDGQGDEGALGVEQRLTARADELDAELQKLEASRERARADLAKVHTQIAGLRAHLGSRDDTIAELEGRIAAARTGFEKTRDEEAAVRPELDAARQKTTQALAALEGAREERSALDAERSTLRDQLRSAEVELETARKELLRARSRLQSLEEIQSRYRGCESGVQVVMAHRERLAELGQAMGGELQMRSGGGGAPTAVPTVHGIMAEFVNAPPELEAAVGAMLGDRLQGVVVDGPLTGASGVALLKDKQEGRTTFLPAAGPKQLAAGASWASPTPGRTDGGIEVVDLSNKGTIPADAPKGDGVLGRLLDLVDIDPQMRGLAETLVGDAIVVDGLPRALELWGAGGVQQTLVTLEGDRLEPSGVVVGGSSDAVESALLQQKREITELAEIVKALEVEFEAARAKANGFAARLDEIERSREASESAVLEAEKSRLGADADVARLVATCERLVAERDESQRVLEALEQTLTQRQSERAEQAATLTGLEQRGPELEAEVDGLAERLRQHEAERLEVGRQLTDAKVAVASWQEKRNALEGTRERLRKQVNSERERKERLQSSAEQGDAQCQRLADEVEGLGVEHVEKVEAHKVAMSRKHDTHEGHDAAKLRVDEHELSLRNLRKALDEERENLAELDLGLRELVLERDHLIGDVRERFDVQLLDVLVDHHARGIAGESEAKRISELRRILSRMGEVNLTAIDEFEEVRQRHDYLEGQRADLESAITQLQDAIDRINKTTKKRFKETFDQVNGMFQQLFPRLFDGGRAELVMTDPSDLLGTGVDIMAQPPGKKIGSLELLSGGEKALTAVSLIFGIFLIKSSPFCLLDEVDAPLDDANVGRFCDLVRELSTQTQFIIITHNKRTMEIADRLYGVTMEQRGISKLVTVNMRRAVDDAHIA